MKVPYAYTIIYSYPYNTTYTVCPDAHVQLPGVPTSSPNPQPWHRGQQHHAMFPDKGDGFLRTTHRMCRFLQLDSHRLTAVKGFHKCRMFGTAKRDVSNETSVCFWRYPWIDDDNDDDTKSNQSYEFYIPSSHDKIPSHSEQKSEVRWHSQSLRWGVLVP